jgi:hypothetical protein
MASTEAPSRTSRPRRPDGSIWNGSTMSSVGMLEMSFTMAVM